MYTYDIFVIYISTQTTSRSYGKAPPNRSSYKPPKYVSVLNSTTISGGLALARYTKN